LALAASLEHLSDVSSNPKAKVLADALDSATGRFLQENKSPLRKAGELDNRGSHFYLAMYWAEALAEQATDQDLKAAFTNVAAALVNNEGEILKELNEVQGAAVNIEGYYRPNTDLVSRAMRPSETLNQALELIK
jgi:isocitrate dehydrogenase